MKKLIRLAACLAAVAWLTVCGMGVFAVSPPVQYRYGDVDNDWTITTTDARIVLQCAVGKIETRSLGDVDGDGKVTTTDARMILQAAVGEENYSYVGVSQKYVITGTDEQGRPLFALEPPKCTLARGARGVDFPVPFGKN